MRISVGGLTGCGKTTLAALLAKELGIEHITFTFKDLAKEKGVSLMEFQEMAKKDPTIDIEFDKAVYEKIKKTRDFVVSTWLGSWYDKLFGIKYDLKIWLSTPDEIKGGRIAKRDGVSLEKALEHLKLRDRQNRERYLDLYNIDIFDNSGFDLYIDNGEMSPGDSVKLVLEYLKKKGRK